MKQVCAYCRGTGLRDVSPIEDEVQTLNRRIQAIKDEACQDWQITEVQLTGKSRATHLVDARRWVAVKLRELGLQYKTIGHHLGGRDHSTIINLLSGKERLTGFAKVAARRSTGVK